MNEMAFRVTSNDGTTIAYDRKGSGPAVVLVGGGLDDGAENAPLVPALAEHFTVYNYARRGRGASGFTEPYAVEREIEDLDALIAEAGGSAHLFGASSGGALALEAAAAGSAIDTIAVWEVPYAVGDDIRPRFEEYIADTRRAFGDRTLMATRVTTKTSLIELLDKFRRRVDGPRDERFVQGHAVLVHFTLSTLPLLRSIPNAAYSRDQ